MSFFGVSRRFLPYLTNGNVRLSRHCLAEAKGAPTMSFERVPLSTLNMQTCRFMATGDGGIVGKLKTFFRVGGFSKSVLKNVGFNLYESMTENVQYDRFLHGLDMPDTFQSWFLVTQLHVWILMVRLMGEGDDGRFMRNAVVEAMWQDVEFRSKQLGDIASSARRKQIQMLADQFQGCLFSYDEGLLSSDKVLAGAIWRNLLQQRDPNPQHLELLVNYIREQVALLDELTTEELTQKKGVKWTQLHIDFNI